MSFLFMFHVNCLHVRILGLLSSQNREAGPFVATQARFGKTGPFLATKSGLGGPFLADKIGPGDHFWVGPVFA